MLVNMKCPSCGATMQYDDSMASMDCPYCGGKVANVAEQVNITQNVNVSGTVVHVQDRSNDPNLLSLTTQITRQLEWYQELFQLV